MYTHEIEQYLLYKHYILLCKEYYYLVETSPQIDHILAEGEEIHLWSNDGLDEKIKIKKWND